MPLVLRMTRKKLSPMLVVDAHQTKKCNPQYQFQNHHLHIAVLMKKKSDWQHNNLFYQDFPEKKVFLTHIF
jgi:hypothetical protein